MNVNWIKCEGDNWCPFLTLDLDHPHFNNLTRLRQWKNKTRVKSIGYLEQKKPCHYIRVLDAILNGGCQGLGSAISFSTSTRRTVLGNLTPTHCAILPATPTVLLRTTKLLPL